MDATSCRNRYDVVSANSSGRPRGNVRQMDLTEKTVVVTGASRGLGKGMAEWFAERGASVGASARSRPTIAGPTVLNESADVTSLEAMQRFTANVAEKLGPIDLWINNAGIADPISHLRNLDYSDLEAHFRVNVGGVLNGTRAYLEHLDATNHSGALVNISSGAANRGMAGAGPYCAGKAAVDRLTQSVALEEPDRLRVVLSLSAGNRGDRHASLPAQSGRGRSQRRRNVSAVRRKGAMEFTRLGCRAHRTLGSSSTPPKR